MNYNNHQSFKKIVKIPCPHCSFLCSPQIKYCSKCGEPLPQNHLLNDLDTSKSFLQNHTPEKNVIRIIEREIQKHIPLLDELKPNLMGYTCENGEISGLSIFKCGLNAIPPKVMMLKTLKKLFLRRNNIKELPEYIGFLSNLELLDLRINEITALPRSIGLLSKLKYLNLSSNNLFSLPSSIGNLSALTKLNLNNNKLKAIPDSLDNLMYLKELKIKANFWITLSESVKKLQNKGILILK